jgi:uncharacterized protein (TIGR02271 family)
MIGRLLRLLLGADSSSQTSTEPLVQKPAVKTTAPVPPQKTVHVAEEPASPPHPTSPRSATVITSDTPATTDEFVVVGENGERYQLLQRFHDNGVEHLVLGRADGAQVTLLRSELIQNDQGRWLLSDAVRDARGLMIPVVEEQLEVSRERVETGRVRISKTVEAREVVVDDPLRRETVRVEHVPINQVVNGDVPQVREEGDVTVIPILEERVVTRTELVLVEEVRIHRERSEYHDPQRVTLRKEVVAVERFGEDGQPLPL